MVHISILLVYCFQIWILSHMNLSLGSHSIFFFFLIYLFFIGVGRSEGKVER